MKRKLHKSILVSIIATISFGNIVTAQSGTTAYDGLTVLGEKVHDFALDNLKLKSIQPVGNDLLLFAEKSSDVMELWFYNSSSKTTTFVTDQFSNHDYQRGYSGFNGMASLNGNYYLGIYNNLTPNFVEAEPYVTNGTSSGTYLLADVRANTSNWVYSSIPTTYINFDNHVFFNADDGLSGGQKVYKHDGNSAPTVATGVYPIRFWQIMNNELYFLSSYGGGSKKGLYKLSDASSLPVFISGFESFYDLQIMGNKLIFWGEKTSGDNIGYEVYVSDGTPEGTILLKDLVPGSQVPVILESGASDKITTKQWMHTFVTLNDIAYFSYQDPTNSKSYLMRTDGTEVGTYPVFTSTSYVRQIFKSGNTITFNGYDDITLKRRTYSIDGNNIPHLIANGSNLTYSFDGANIEGKWAFDDNANLIGKITLYVGNTSYSNYIGFTDGTDLNTKAYKVIDNNNNFLDVNYIDDVTAIGEDVFFVMSSNLYKINRSSSLGTKEENIENDSVLVYINSSDKLIIEWKDYANVTAEIFNTQGQLVHHSSLQSFKTAIEMNKFARGVYLVKIKSPKGEIVKKVIKN